MKSASKLCLQPSLAFISVGVEHLNTWWIWAGLDISVFQQFYLKGKGSARHVWTAYTELHMDVQQRNQNWLMCNCCCPKIQVPKYQLMRSLGMSVVSHPASLATNSCWRQTAGHSPMTERHIMRSSVAYSLTIRNKGFKRAPMQIDRGPWPWRSGGHSLSRRLHVWHGLRHLEI